ncbi:MAG: exo-alpha-sialidase [Ignavibacteria bacterium]|nr:exo-alpha-sialidase [Ignavibacteria bacterium]
MKIFWLLLFTTFSISVTPVHTQAQIDPTFIFPKSETNRQYPKVKRGDDGTLVVTYVELVGNVTTVYVSISTDSGETWSEPTSPGTVKYASIGLQRQPYTIVDNTGVLHGLWENNEHAGNLLLYYTRSADNGATWTTPANVYVPTQGTQDFSSIASDRDGNIYITYLAYEEKFSDGSKHVFMLRSSDRGLSWGFPVRVDRFIVGGSCECCIQNVATSSSGEVAVVFRSNISNRRDIFVCRSQDNGATFDEPVLVQDEKWMINACPSTGPSLAYDGAGNLHIAWRDSRNAVGLDAAYYARVPLGSRETPTNISLSAGFSQTAEYPVPAVSDKNSNEVMVVFESSLGVAYAYSRDAGESFTTEKLDPLVVRSSGVAAVFTDEHKPLILWQADRDGVFDIAMAQPEEFLPVSVQEESGNGLSRISYVDGNLVSSSPDSYISTISMHSLTGELIFTTNTTGNAFSRSIPINGVAFVTVQLSNGAQIRRMVIRE